MVQEIPDRISAKVKGALSGGLHVHAGTSFPWYGTLPPSNALTLSHHLYCKILNHMYQASQNAQKIGNLLTKYIAQISLVICNGQSFGRRYFYYQIISHPSRFFSHPL